MIFFLLPYDVINIFCDDNFVAALEEQIQINRVLQIEPRNFVKWWNKLYKNLEDKLSLNSIWERDCASPMFV